MDEVIAKVGPEANIEIAEHHSGNIRTQLFLSPQDGAYLARGLLSCVAAIYEPDSPPPGTIIMDSHIPVLRWKVDTSHGELVLTLTIPSGIDLNFRVKHSDEHINSEL